jgi:hypothetical protein
VKIYVDYEVEFMSMKIRTLKLILRESINTVLKSKCQIKAGFFLTKISYLVLNIQADFGTAMQEVYERFGNW